LLLGCGSGGVARCHDLLKAACKVGHQCGGGINNTTEQKGGQ
jgi:hypothetical protein